MRAREVLQRNEDSPEWQDALRLLAGRLDLPKETLAGLTPKGGVRHARRGALAEAAREGRAAGAERARRVRRSIPALVKLLAELSPEHFDSELHRRFRALLVEGGEEDEALLALRAELDARAAREGLDERTGKELLLHLRERRLRRELAGAELERMKELQAALAKLDRSSTGDSLTSVPHRSQVFTCYCRCSR